MATAAPTRVAARPAPASVVLAEAMEAMEAVEAETSNMAWTLCCTSVCAQLRAAA
jgi:hypothetical protein